MVAMTLQPLLCDVLALLQAMMALGAYRSQLSLVLAWTFAVLETFEAYRIVHPYAMWAHFWCVVFTLVRAVLILLAVSKKRKINAVADLMFA
jgi:hypothetical protein